MNRVTLIGNDMKLDSGVGTCGKDGQSAGGVGMPTVRMEGLTVGGTARAGSGRRAGRAPGPAARCRAA